MVLGGPIDGSALSLSDTVYLESVPYQATITSRVRSARVSSNAGLGCVIAVEVWLLSAIRPIDRAADPGRPRLIRARSFPSLRKRGGTRLPIIPFGVWLVASVGWRRQDGPSTR